MEAVILRLSDLLQPFFTESPSARRFIPLPLIRRERNAMSRFGILQTADYSKNATQVQPLLKRFPVSSERYG